MFKSRVPFCFSIAFFIAVPTVPTSADTGKHAAMSGKHTRPKSSKISPAISAKRSAISPKRSTTSTRQEISLPLTNDQGMKFVHNYIRNNDQCLYVVRQRSEEPFSIIDSVLSRYGLPLELKYLAVIESELKSSARSPVGARGPWQLMPGTAHVLGLKVNRGSDERTNYYKSTVAAAKYLRDLHREFGDWLLVLAAYNGGPVPVYRAIRKAHDRSFWAIQKYLPAESRQHVKKFIATAYYFERAGKLNPVPRPSMQLVSVPIRINPASGTPESDEDKFQRLMFESAKSLKESNELMGN